MTPIIMHPSPRLLPPQREAGPTRKHADQLRIPLISLAPPLNSAMQHLGKESSKRNAPDEDQLQDSQACNNEVGFVQPSWPSAVTTLNPDATAKEELAKKRKKESRQQDTEKGNYRKHFENKAIGSQIEEVDVTTKVEAPPRSAQVMLTL